MSKLINEIGKQYNLLTVKEKAPSRNGKTFWLCQCECGRMHEVNASNLRTGAVKSCGQCVYANKKQDLSNQQFGVLKVIKEAPNQNGKIMWECECVYCKSHIIVSGTNLKTGHTKSCNCINGSTGEHIIRQALIDNNINFKAQFIFNDFKLSSGGRPKFDFAIFTKNSKLLCLIEYDGEQHYIATGGWNDDKNHTLTQTRDIEKTQYCLEHNIPLIRVPFYELNKINILYLLTKIEQEINKQNA